MEKKRLWNEAVGDYFYSAILGCQFVLKSKRTTQEVNKIRNFVKWAKFEHELKDPDRKNPAKHSLEKITLGLKSTFKNIESLITERAPYSTTTHSRPNPLIPPQSSTLTPKYSPLTDSTSPSTTGEGGPVGQKRTREEKIEDDQQFSFDAVGRAEALIENLLTFLEQSREYRMERMQFYNKFKNKETDQNSDRLL